MTKENFWKILATLAIIVALGVAIFGGKKTVMVGVSPTSQNATNYDSLTLGTNALDYGSTSPKVLPTTGVLVNNGSVEITKSFTCNDASTTLFSIQEPFATSSQLVDWAINIFGVSTTSGSIVMGTSTTATHASSSINASSLYRILDSVPIEQSQFGIISPRSRVSTSSALNLKNGYLLASSSIFTGSALSVQLTQLTEPAYFASTTNLTRGYPVKPSEFISAYVEDRYNKESGCAGLANGCLEGFLNAANTFQCNGWLKFRR